MAKKKKPKKYYAVIFGRKNFTIVRSWASCSALVTGHSNSIFKSFKDEEMAIWYMNNFIPHGQSKESMSILKLKKIK